MYSTILARIVALSEAETRLLSKDEGLDETERKQFAEIRASLAPLWPQRRAELVFHAEGPPRVIGSLDPRSQRQIARGIAPLPQGGD